MICKNYQWLLSRLIGTKISVLEIGFTSNDITRFFSDKQGVLRVVKDRSFQGLVKQFLHRRITGFERDMRNRPIAYSIQRTSKRLLMSREANALSKQQKPVDIKALILACSTWLKEDTIIEVVLHYENGALHEEIQEKVLPKGNSRLVKNSFIKEQTMALSGILVSAAEKAVDMKVIRMKYEFVITMDYVPCILFIDIIKFIPEHLISLNEPKSKEELEELETKIKRRRLTKHTIFSYTKRPTILRLPSEKSETTDEELESPNPILPKNRNLNFEEMVTSSLLKYSKKVELPEVSKPQQNLIIRKHQSMDILKLTIPISRSGSSLSKAIEAVKKKHKSPRMNPALVPYGLQPSVSDRVMTRFLKEEKKRIKAKQFSHR